jgi:tRNA/tmRNA/rRNA uracil-C5-methylase (TrmA/RlmC/RlmD family)
MANTPASTTRTGAVFPEQYEEQLSAKIGQVRELFAAHKLPSEIEVFRSATSNFRMRAEFTIWHEVRRCSSRAAHGPVQPAATAASTPTHQKLTDSNLALLQRSGSSGQDEDLYYVMFEKPEGAEGDAAAAAGSDNDPQTDTTATAAAAAASNTDAEAAADAGPGSSEAAEQPSSGAAAAAAAAEPPQSNGRARGKSRNKKRGRSPGSSRKQALRVRIDDFPVASQLICSLMPLLRQELLASDTLREKLFQVNFHTTLSKQGMITLLYHKQVRQLAGSLLLANFRSQDNRQSGTHAAGSSAVRSSGLVRHLQA